MLMHAVVTEQEEDEEPNNKDAVSMEFSILFNCYTVHPVSFICS